MSLETYHTYLTQETIKLIQIALQDIDLRNSENIVDKFKFNHQDEGSRDNFDDLLRVYLELIYIEFKLLGTIEQTELEVLDRRGKIGDDFIES